MLARLVAVAALGSVVFLQAVACGTDPVGVDACQRIEQARCESAQACGIDLGRPTHSGSSEAENVAACTRYYQDQCLHGLSSGAEPGSDKVDACVSAILTGTCDTVREPQTNAACSFLIPPSAVVSDAAADG